MQSTGDSETLPGPRSDSPGGPADSTHETIKLPAGARGLAAQVPRSDETTKRRPLSSLAPGLRLGDYELLQEVARGGVGMVFKARQVSLDRTVALKVLVTVSTSPEQLERFHREALTAARLSHPNIVPIYEVGVEEGCHFIAMEYVHGFNLKELATSCYHGESPVGGILRASSRPLPPGWTHGTPPEPREVVRIVREVCRAIHHAHQNGVLHRDVKPQNVLVDAGGIPKITDFGLAKEVGSKTQLTMTGDVLGTPAYMAPEQAKGEVSRIGVPSDVYSLGALLYELVTGRTPYEGESVYVTLRRVAEEDLVPPTRFNRRVHRDIETIVLHAMEKDARRRYATALEMADDIDRFLRGEPIAARPAGLVERWGRRARRHARVLALASLLVAAIATLGGVSLHDRRVLAEARAEADAETRRAAARLRAQEEALLSERVVRRETDAVLLIEQGDAAGAVRILDDVLALAPRRANALFHRGRARERMGRADLASEDYSGAIAVDPSFAPARFTRGMLRASRGDLAGALEDLDAALALQEGTADQHATRATIRIQKGDRAGAIGDLTRAIELAPHCCLYRRRGAALLDAGRLDEAEGDLREAVRLNRACSESYYHLARVLFERKDVVGAWQVLLSGRHIVSGADPAFIARVQEAYDALVAAGRVPAAPAPGVREHGVELSYRGKYAHWDFYRELIDSVPAAKARALGRIRERLGIAYEDRDTVVLRFQDMTDPPPDGIGKQTAETSTRAVNGRGEVTIVFNMEYLVTRQAEFDEQLTHELTHAVMRERMGDAYAKVPKWLREGLAIDASGQGPGRVKHVISTATTEAQALSPLNGLENARRSLDDYAEDFLAVAYVRERHGDEALRKVVSDVMKGTGYREAISSSLGLSWEAFCDEAGAFSREWVRRLISGSMPAFREAMDRCTQGSYAAAMEGFARVVDQQPESYCAPVCAYYKAKCLYCLRRNAEAVRGYEEFLARHPRGSGLVDDAKFVLSDCYWQAGEREKGMAALEEFLRDYPIDERLVGEARERLARWKAEGR